MMTLAATLGTLSARFHLKKRAHLDGGGTSFEIGSTGPEEL